MKTPTVKSASTPNLQDTQRRTPVRQTCTNGSNSWSFESSSEFFLSFTSTCHINGFEFRGLNCFVELLHTRSLNCLDRDTFGFQQPCRLVYCRVMSQNRVISTWVSQMAFVVLVLRLCQHLVLLDQPVSFMVDWIPIIDSALRFGKHSCIFDSIIYNVI
jgi:hypothetical protein